MNKMASIVAIMAIFTLAVGFVIIGSVSVELKNKLGIDDAGIGKLVVIFALTCMFTQLLMGFSVAKFGHKSLAIAGFLLTAVSIFLLGFAGTFAAVVVTVVLLGIGSILCSTVGNTLLPVVLFDGKDPIRAGNFGHGFASLGFIFTSVIIAALIGAGAAYSVAVSVVGVLVLIFAVFAMIATYPQVSTGFSMGQALHLLSKPLVLLASLAMVCCIGMEWSYIFFTKSLMADLFNADSSENAVRNAGFVLALFGLAMGVGRFATSAIKNVSQNGAKVVAVAALISIIPTLLLAKTGNTTLAVIAVGISGLSFAPIFPTIVGFTFAKFNPSLYGSIIGIILSIGLIGPVVLPRLLSSGGTVQKNLPIVAIAAGVLVVVAVLMGMASNAMKLKKTE